LSAEPLTRIIEGEVELSPLGDCESHGDLHGVFDIDQGMKTNLVDWIVRHKKGTALSGAVVNNRRVLSRRRWVLPFC
jgi:hypothetical protein